MGLRLKFAVKISILTTLFFLFLFSRVGFAITISELAPAHPRPYLLPESYKSELLSLVENRSWAKQNFSALKGKATDGDGFSAALLFALSNEQQYLSQAKKWLLNIAENGGDLGSRAIDADAAFFKQGMPWLGDVYYNLDTRPLQAFDYIYDGLSVSERELIQSGLSASASFRKNAMNTWWQTPNLVFKPTSMVAIHGLLTQDPSFIQWGFFRKSRTNPGGYFTTLNTMLKDNGPWYEAPVYAISHRPLSLSLEITDYLNRLTGKDWFNRTLEGGSSVRGLIDYYIKTTYPAETMPNGEKAYRLLTYGDGATGQRGDIYLLSDNPFQRNMKQELTAAYKISRDPDYAAFLKLDERYQPDLFNKPPLPISPLMPLAPSSIWKNFGLAFIRSDNTRGYWNNPDAMAVSLLFRQGYGHGHSDALSITLFAAGRLFYPDYNAVQYENPAIGWTSSSIAHNTVVVDGMNSTLPKSVKTVHDFGADVDWVQATVNERLGITKIRTLVLTGDYLLDIFHVNSLTPRTYDYLLHSFGKIQTGDEKVYSPSAPYSPRYASVNDFKSLTTDEQWSVDFIIDLDQQLKRTGQLISQFTDKNRDLPELRHAFGIDNTSAFRSSGLRVDMAGHQDTQVGTGEDNYGLSFLAARRRDKKYSTFVSTHTPYFSDYTGPGIILETLIDNRAGTIVKITTQSSIDIYAISHLGGKIRLTNHNASILAEFTDYAYLRINKKTHKSDQGGNWQQFSFPPQVTGLKDAISHGTFNAQVFHSIDAAESKIQINSFPELLVLKDFADSSVTISVTNLTGKTINPILRIPESTVYAIPGIEIRLGLIEAYETYSTKINLGRYIKASGIDVLPVNIELGETAQSISHGIMISAGPGLMETYEDINNPAYRIYTFNSSVDLAMRDGAVLQIKDNQNKTIYSGQPLFSLSDGQTTFSTWKNTIDTSYTWPSRDQASVISEINNRIRWHLLTVQDRFYIRLDDVYTRAQTVSFIFDKQNTAIDWNRARYITGNEKRLLTAASGSHIRARGLELPLNEKQKSICVASPASMQWQNNDESLRLSITRDSNEQWSFGICDKDTLAAWLN